MSKAIIASDIHGNIYYTQKLEELIIKENPDYILLLGDLDSTFNPSPVSTILNKYAPKIYAVRGNNDPLDTTGKYQFNNNQDYCYIKMDNLKFFLTHGHTHIYNIYGMVINPGSVGRPRLNHFHTCIIYENKNLKLINLDNFNIIDSNFLN